MSNSVLPMKKWHDPLIEQTSIVTREDGDKFANVELSKEAYDWGIIFFPHEIKYLLDNIHLDELDRDEIDDGDLLACSPFDKGQAISFTLSHRANNQSMILTKLELDAIYSAIKP